MSSFKQPEILAPGDKQLARPAAQRTNFAQGLFSDENLDLLSHLLDDCFTIPGTSVRFGLDGIMGFIPGIGDLLAGLASCILIVAAWFRGVPYITLARMIGNVWLEVAVGSIPFLGDVFVIAWKANRRNYALLTRHIDEPHRKTWGDWIFVGLLALGLLVIFLAPVIVVVLIAVSLRHRP